MKTKILWLALTFATIDLPADTHYVSLASPNATPPYTTWTTAATNIQHAVDVASAGDSVLVNDGVYAVGERETFDSDNVSLGFNRVAITKPISLRSLNGPQFTVIDGALEVRGVTLASGGSLSGFTISNGSPSGVTIWTYGGGVWCYDTSAVITNCVLTANSAWSDGGGVFGGTLYDCTLAQNSANYGPGGGACGSVLYNCTLTDNTVGSGSAGAAWGSTLVNCLVSGNRAYAWGGVGNCTLRNCEIRGNSSWTSGGGAYGATLQNCTITGNWAEDAGGGAYACTLYNCTVTGNSSGESGGGVSASELYNCILYFNTALTAANYDATSDLNYCCTTPLPPKGIGNSSLDPQLASASRLSAGSPCRGAGAAAYAAGTDLDGEPWRNPPSIGCDEYYAGALTGPLTVEVWSSLLANYTNVSAGFPVDFMALIQGRAAVSAWNFGDGTVVSNRPYASHAWAAPGDYTVVLRAYNETFPGGVSGTMNVHVVDGRHYVAAGNPNPQPPYDSWATAATNIQDAVDAAFPGALILVTNGVYDSDYGVVVYKPMSLRSVNGPEFTRISGQAGYVDLVDVASLSGFTITAGWGLGCVASGVVTNCIITGSSGGGARGGTLYNCTLTNNSANSGGGASDCTLYNCTLAGNLAIADYWDGGGYGGGAYRCKLYNCTITGNSALADETVGGGYGGGVYDCTLYNCIVYFNTASKDANYDADSIFNYSCTTPLPASGTGNTALDPQLSSHNRLSAASPCRGAGNLAFAVGKDLDGEPWRNPPSMGCDEYHAGAVTGSLAISFTASTAKMTVGYPVDFTAVIEGRPTVSVWDFGDGVIVSNRPYASHSWAAVGDYLVVLRAYNETLPAGVSTSTTIHVVQPVHYVAAYNANPQPPYDSWATAATNIQDAVGAAVLPGSTVLVTNGVYGGGVGVTTPLALRSVSGPQFTFINGRGSNRCISLSDGASLAGFTLTNGRAGDRGAGVSCATTNEVLTNCVIVGNQGGVGGGAFGGTLYNCTLADNSAISSGGGVYGSKLYNCSLTGNRVAGSWVFLSGSIFYAPGSGAGAGGSTLYNCLLSGNSSADYGGGVAGSTLHNCLLDGNTAVGGRRVQGQERFDVPGIGGAAYSSTLYNCTLTGNSATDHGGGAYGGALYNCIVYLNTASAGANYGTNSSLEFCCTTPLPTNGLGNITIYGNKEEKTLFADYAGGNLRLQSNSPCINAGNNRYESCTPDLDGRPRVVGGTVDIGAYEFPAPRSILSYAWAQQFGLATDGSADFADGDADGMSNWQEWRCLTCPTNALSVLRLLKPARTGAHVAVSWQSIAGVNYSLECGMNLSASPGFTLLATNLIGQGGMTTYTHTNAANATPLFYRVGVRQ